MPVQGQKHQIIYKARQRIKILIAILKFEVLSRHFPEQ